MTPWTRSTVAAAGILLLLPSVAACADDPLGPEPVDTTCPVEAGGPVTLVVGARANSPAPSLPDEVHGLIREAAKQSRKVQIVRLDGEPEVTYAGTFRTNARNSPAIASKLAQFLDTTRAQFVAQQPSTPEADVLSALTQAGRATPAGGTIVLIDSGLQTTGEISFRAVGMFDVHPTEVVAFLDDRGLLPDLGGRAVVLVGLGNTAEPQGALDSPTRNQVINVWTAVIEASGPACVHPLPVPEHRTSIETDVPVTPVPLPEQVVFEPCGETVLRDGGSVGFLPDLAVLRDPDAARETLGELSDRIVVDGLQARLEGSTATAGNSEESRKRLAKERAEAVKAVLVELGVEPDSIETVGLGTDGDDRVDDTDENGNLIPDLAAQNRKVVVKLSCPS